MNKWFLGLYLLFILSSCGESDNSANQSKKILQSPPFAGVTDSIGRFPKQSELYLQRALLLSRQNQHDLAYEDYKTAWSLRTDEATGLLYAGNLLMINNLKEAGLLLQDCIKRFPANREFPRRLAEVYIQTGQNAKALLQLDEELAKDSTDFETWYEKGRLLAQLTDTAGAIKALKTAYLLQPINHTGVALAELYGASRNPDVITICDELIAKDSLGIQTDPYFIKGTYYSDIRQYKPALAAFEECIKRDWKFTDAYIEKGIVLYEQKQVDTALHVFVMAATISNTNADSYYWMARCFETKGDTEQALLNYQRAVSLDRNFGEAKEGIKRLMR